MPFFTIFIPTFNRGDILQRTLNSIRGQKEHDLEVIIVDDGSTDNTKEVVEDWRQAVDFNVIYLYQPNQGKAAAHNTMLKHAQGELTILLDSDDLLAENALATIRHHWKQAKQEPDCAGIEGLSIDLETGGVLGTVYPRDGMLCNYLKMRQQYGVKGDKLNAIKTSVLKAFPFPRFAGEKHVPPSTVWSRIAHQYQFLHINEALQKKEYRADGITKGWDDKKTHNPCGYRQFYLEILNDHKDYYALSKRFSCARRYVYLSLLCGIKVGQQVSEMHNKLLYAMAFPLGFLKYLKTKNARSAMTRVR